MNILFVSAVLPYPLHSGGQIRIYNLLKRLSKKHSITLASFIRSEDERSYTKALDFCDSVHLVMRGRAWQPKYYIGALFSAYPFLLYTYSNRLMKATLRMLLSKKKYDLIHVEPFYVLPSIPEHSIPLVISEHNVEYSVYESFVRRFPVPFLRPLLSWDVGKLRHWEHIAWKTADALTAVSCEDASMMSVDSNNVCVVPNGVDLSAFSFREPVKRKNPTIVFVGNFRWYPNRDAANELLERIWPGIQKRIPRSQLSIVGRDMPAELKQRVIHAGGNAYDTIENIAQVYKNADMLVAPHAIAGGTKFKMLEAMASGLPVVTSKEGMFGLSAVPDTHYFLAQTPQEYVDQVYRIWDNAASTKVVAANARKLVESEYSWEHIANALESVWKNAYEHI